jgi:hypothetical protein
MEVKALYTQAGSGNYMYCCAAERYNGNHGKTPSNNSKGCGGIFARCSGRIGHLKGRGISRRCRDRLTSHMDIQRISGRRLHVILLSDVFLMVWILIGQLTAR